jgi:hypothetical protein
MSTPNSQAIRFKRGDTVMLGCEATDEGGQPIDLTGVDVTAQVWPNKDGQPMVAELVLVWVDRSQGRYELWAPGNGLATAWPTGNLKVDIQYSQPSGQRVLRRSSETFFLFIEPDVTQ